MGENGKEKLLGKIKEKTFVDSENKYTIIDGVNMNWDAVYVSSESSGAEDNDENDNDENV